MMIAMLVVQKPPIDNRENLLVHFIAISCSAHIDMDGWNKQFSFSV